MWKEGGIHYSGGGTMLGGWHCIGGGEGRGGDGLTRL